MFDEKFDIGPVTLARGSATDFGDVYDASVNAMRAQGNLLSGFQMQEQAYDEANAAIKATIGVDLDNPYRQADKYSAFGKRRDFHAEWERRRADLEMQNPEQADVLRKWASPRAVAEERARKARDEQADAVSRYGSGAWAPSLAGGFRGSLEDPTTWVSMALGPMGRVGVGAKEVLWMGVKSGAANAAVEVASQPFIRQWRQQAGIETSWQESATDVAVAFAFGFGADAGVRAGYRAVQAGRGRVAILDADGKVTGYKATGPADDALQDAAAAAPKTSLVRQAADGDADAIHRLAKQAGVDQDPAYKGARAEVALSEELAPAYKLPDTVDPDDGFTKLTQAMRAAIDPDEPLPRGADPIAPAKPAKQVIDDAAPRQVGETFKRDGKRVTLERVDPQTIGTDPAAFQFKGGGDGAGEIGTLAGVQQWDPLSSNRVIVFERADGSRVIADGHQRLGLAKRLADQKPELDAFVMRETDGWTAGDVRAIAAQKNLKEGSGSTIDAAKILRERPDLVDGSLPLNNAAMRQARALSRLDDAAFGEIVSGGAEPAHGALIGDLVENRALHAGMLAELTRAAPETLREARLLVGEMLEAKSVREVQETLFGLATVERTLHAERAKVLDKAIKAAARDARLFGLVERERGRLTEAGNKLSAANATEAERAAVMGEMIERLGRTRGPVSDWLDEAARQVAAGTKPQTAADAFAARVARALEEDGMAGLTRQEPRIAGIDDPAGPEIDARIQSLDKRLENALRSAKAADAGEPVQGVMFAIRAFHGSPHDFDKFDLSKIGTGEGAQAYGHGLYFAESEGVAKSYRDNLGGYDWGRDVPPRLVDGMDISYDVKRALDASQGDVAKARNQLVRDTGVPGREAMDAEALRLLDEIAPTLAPKPTGRMYEVSIKADPNDFLDWDKPLSQQSDKVRDAISRFDPEMSPYLRDNYTGQTFMRDYSGSEAGGYASSSLGTSQALREAGIPGIRYLDQGSRGAGEGSRNYVVFDDSLIEIVAKDGKPITAADRKGVLFGLRQQQAEQAAIAVARAATDAALLDGKHALTGRASADMAALKADIAERVRKIAPSDVGIRVHDALHALGRDVDGYFDPHERLIHIALSADDPLRVGVEEAGHALKAAGLVTDADYALLTRFAEAKGLRKAFDIDGRYGKIYSEQWKGDKGRIEAALVEETVMQMLARRATGERFDTVIDRVLDAINRVLNAVREALGLRGYRSVHDVFRAFEAGDLAANVPAVDLNRLSSLADPPRAATVRAFHATNRDFGRFDLAMASDFGVHFGTARQAATRLRDTKRMDGGRTIPVDVTVRNAIKMDDPGFWGPMEVVGALQKQGYRVTQDEWQRFRVLADAIDVADSDVRRIGDTVRPRLKQAVNAANLAVKAKLDELGIDGIWYKNQTEGRGWSLAVWGQNQVRNAYSRDVMLAFAGEKAATADLAKRAAAIALEKAGKSREEIWTETGWFKGVDGKWRFEISDDGVDVNRALINDVADGKLDDAMAHEILPHDRLFQAYPELAYLTTQVRKDSGGGSFGANVIEIGTRESRRTMLHELQHGVQAEEGFARGGSPDKLVVTLYNRIVDQIRRLIDDAGGDLKMATPEIRDEVARLRAQRKMIPDDNFEAYRRLAGEVEARVVEKRAGMTPEERAARPPWLDFDVAAEQQIVRMVATEQLSLESGLRDADRFKDYGDLVGACKL